jgi:hypothetical protein
MKTLNRNRQYRILIRHIKPVVHWGWEAQVERAAGDAICPTCELELREHAVVDSGTVIDCTGRIWKL